jgi:hypothetical protein
MTFAVEPLKRLISSSHTLVVMTLTLTMCLETASLCNVCIKTSTIGHFCCCCKKLIVVGHHGSDFILLMAPAFYHSRTVWMEPRIVWLEDNHTW